MSIPARSSAARVAVSWLMPLSAAIFMASARVCAAERLVILFKASSLARLARSEFDSLIWSSASQVLLGSKPEDCSCKRASCFCVSSAFFSSRIFSSFSVSTSAFNSPTSFPISSGCCAAKVASRSGNNKVTAANAADMLSSPSERPLFQRKTGTAGAGRRFCHWDMSAVSCAMMTPPHWFKSS